MYNVPVGADRVRVAGSILTGEWAIKQRIQSSPCHRHMVIATNFSSMFDLLLCSTPQTWAECCLELTVVSGVGGVRGLNDSAELGTLQRPLGGRGVSVVPSLLWA